MDPSQQSEDLAVETGKEKLLVREITLEPTITFF